MEIPENLRTALASVDDAYLIGLSNKGTVNRAKKDLAGLSPTAEISADGISVTVAPSGASSAPLWVQAPAPAPAALCAATG